MRRRFLPLLFFAACAGSPKGGQAISDNYAALGEGRYRYVSSESKEKILDAVDDLGGATTANPARLAHAADRLFFVLAVDENADVRAAACTSLQRIRNGLSAPPKATVGGAGAKGQIHAIAQVFDRGPPDDEIIAALGELAAADPPTFLSARELLRILLTPPVIDSKSKKVRAALVEAAPVVTRRAIDVALDQAAHGRTRSDPSAKPDPSPEVRAAAN